MLWSCCAAEAESSCVFPNPAGAFGSESISGVQVFPTLLGAASHEAHTEYIGGLPAGAKVEHSVGRPGTPSEFDFFSATTYQQGVAREGGGVERTPQSPAQSPATLAIKERWQRCLAAQGDGAPVTRAALEIARIDDFLPSAATGRACVCFNEATGQRSEAVYHVDGSNARVIVQAFSESGARDVLVPIGAIEDIYTISDGDDCFAPKLIAALAPEERERLFLLVFAQGSDDALQSLCLLEKSSEDRDKLLDLLRILCQ
uniref:Uncharacterized protein n=1 Tax=Zooxanthella nutricula TaxID=1333877 RepID=A0A6V0E5Q8_9DINO|mmetsp:Transcript_15751/g.46728  ORF Transcript_15751/g.46728 Transcript_15751/m.46728 type:complete len:259 (+) Transcript_15751:95-871(+)